MSTRQGGRLLSIGEFAAATQLTPKALRLYDEQRLLPPASIDANTGYRYYRADQVPVGRLIRTLKDTGLSLAQIAQVATARGAQAEAVLRQLAQETDRRHAREKRALQLALVSLRAPAVESPPAVIVSRLPDLTMSVWPFVSDRQCFAERYRVAVARAHEALAAARLAASGPEWCNLLEPLSDEEGQLEILIPVVVAGAVPTGLTLRTWPACACATTVRDAQDRHAADLTGTLDALFDWLDRAGYRAARAPLIAIRTTDAGLRTEAIWAFEPSP
jgi:DNA-binding transcriptional MerR regulator